jgi:hypothetical protein
VFAECWQRSGGIAASWLGWQSQPMGRYTLLRPPQCCGVAWRHTGTSAEWQRSASLHVLCCAPLSVAVLHGGTLGPVRNGSVPLRSTYSAAPPSVLRCCMEAHWDQCGMAAFRFAPRTLPLPLRCGGTRWGQWGHCRDKAEGWLTKTHKS